MANYTEHSFYCINCGRRGIPVQRRDSHNHSKHHRKKLWCIYCGREFNHIECRTDEEVREFREQFEAGVFKEEALLPIGVDAL